MPKYKLPSHLSKKKILNRAQRQKIYENVDGILRKLILDPEFPLIEAEGCIEQGITKSCDIFPPDVHIDPNGTFTLTFKVNGGVQNIEENESIISVKSRGLFHGKSR